MLQFPKRYLLLSSIILLVAGCRISKYNHLKCVSETSISPIIKSNTVLKYKASIDVLKNHLTGFIIAKQTDSITKHIVFVTELGMKMFDFEVKNKEIKAMYVFEPLNKPLMIEALKRNFSNMFFLNIEGGNFSECSNKKYKRVIKVKEGKEKWFYSTTPADDKTVLDPLLQETFHKRKRSSKIEYIVKQDSPMRYNQIKCKQYGLIKFYFELNLIE